MKAWKMMTVAAFLCGLSGSVSADPDKDESGHGRDRYGQHERKEEYWDGNCKVERKWEKNGEYKEERKCKGHDHGDDHYQSHATQVVVNLPPWFESTSGEPEYRPGWEPQPSSRPADRGTIQCNSSQVGSVLGGLIGGVLGHQVGAGRGKTAATIGGAIGGVFIGGEIGRRMDSQRQACIAQVLEFAPPGEVIAWEDPESHEQYAVLPGEIEKQGDSYCRSFSTEVQGSGHPQKTSSMACRRPDGVWVAESI